jgi:WD40 repeat protein/serine/threonine protein kinase
MIGRTVGDFVVTDKLDEGGFSEIYRAYQPALGRDAVVKIRRGPGASEAETQRFLREARLAAQIDHPYAAHIYAFGAEPDGLLWIAMELVRGTPLSTLLRVHGALSLDRFVPLFERLCEVVQSVHDRGIIHRDIKPANVMVVSHAGRLLPKLIDLGIATGIHGTAAFESPGPRTPADARTRPSDQATSGAATLVAHRRAALGSRLDKRPGHDRLTRTGQALGSPAYMAPEQWYDQSAVDTRTDLYALAVVAFECLTGRPPFSANEVSDFERMHREEPPPRLPPPLPVALGLELQTALSKCPADRHPSALALAAAVRAASGITEVANDLPRLPSAVVDRVLGCAPRPIADAIAIVEGAATLRLLRTSIARATRLIVRYLGVIGLTARAGLPPEACTLEPARALLEQLPRRPLSDDEWLRMLAALCHPMVEARDAFPIPELLDFLTGAAPGRDALAVLVAASSAAPTPDDVAERRALARSLADLATVLDGLAFLSGYAIGTGDVAVRWMGASRAAAAAAVSPEVDACVRLYGTEGGPLIDLGPLVRIASPMPGAAVELFVFAGHGPRGALLLSASGYEITDHAVWDWFARHVLPGERETRAGAASEAPPFRGLAPLTIADADVFFGRDADLTTFHNRLRASPLLAVVGASGAGKSSFVLAGVAANLSAEWRAIVLRPGTAPLAALAAAVSAVRRTGAPAVEPVELHADPGALGRWLQELAAVEPRAGAAAPDGRGSLLIIDQLEELFTLCHDDLERRRFALAITGAAASADGHVRVILIVRDDFLARAQELDGLRGRIGAGVFLLPTPTRSELLQTLLEPCRRAGYDFDEADLAERMVADVAGRPAALPLLAFAAARLWELRDPQLRRLRAAVYVGMGGVAGALVKHAEATLLGLPSTDQQLVREVFRRLVTAEGTRAVLSRAELIRITGADDAAERVVEALVASRLLTVRDRDAGTHVEIIHEALITEWPRLIGWREDDRIGARTRDQIHEAAHLWDERGRRTDLLWRGDALADLKRWIVASPMPLTETEAAFVAASQADARSVRRRRRAVIAIASLASAAALATILWFSMRAAREHDRSVALADSAQAQRAFALFERGRRASLDGDSQLAALAIVRSIELGRDTPAARLVLAEALRPLRAQKVLWGHGGAVLSIAVSPDRKQIATAGEDGTVRIWSRDGKLERELRGLVWVSAVTYTPDGTRLVVAAEDGSARLWSPRGDFVATLEAGENSNISVVVSSDSSKVMTATDGEVRIWDAHDGRLLRTLPNVRPSRWLANPLEWRLRGTLLRIRPSPFNPVGPSRRRLASSNGNLAFIAHDFDDRIRAVDLGTGAMLEPFEVGSNVRQLAVSHDVLAAAGADGVIRLWSFADRELLAMLTGHREVVTAMAFSDDGLRLATGDPSGHVRLWNVTTRGLLAAFDASEDMVTDIAFAPEGDRVAVAQRRGVYILDASTGFELARFAGHATWTWALAFVDRGLVATASSDLSVRLWDAAPQHLVAEVDVGSVLGLVPPADLRRNLDPISMDPSRTRLLAGGWRGAVILDAATGQVLEWARRAPNITAVAWSSDGAQIAFGNATGQVSIRAGNSTRTVIAADGITGSERVVMRLAFSLDGHSLAVTLASRAVRVIDLDDLRVQTVSERIGAFRDGAVWGDGGLLAVAQSDGSVTVRSRGSAVTVLPKDSNVSVLAFAGADLLAATRGHDGVTIERIDTRAQRPPVRFLGQSAESHRLISTPTLLLSLGADATAHIWDRAGAQLAILRGARDQLADAVALGDNLVATIDWGGYFDVWGIDGERILTIRVSTDNVHGLLATGRGRFAAIGSDGIVRIWRAELETRPMPAVAAELRCLTPFTLNDHDVPIRGTTTCE